MSTLFISCSRKDQASAQRVHDELVALGYSKTFLDNHPDHGIRIGEEYQKVLYRKLKRCKGLIAVCSANWETSRWCFAEATQAQALRKNIFPLLIDDTTAVPEILAKYQAIRLSDPDTWDRLSCGLREAGILPPRSTFGWWVAAIIVACLALIIAAFQWPPASTPPPVQPPDPNPEIAPFENSLGMTMLPVSDPDGDLYLARAEVTRDQWRNLLGQLPEAWVESASGGNTPILNVSCGINCPF